MSWHYYDTLVRIARGQLPVPPPVSPSFTVDQSIHEYATVTVTGPPLPSLALTQFMDEHATVAIEWPTIPSFIVNQFIDERATVTVQVLSPVGVATGLTQAIAEIVSLTPKCAVSNTISESVGVKVA